MAWKFFTSTGAEKRVPASVVNPMAKVYGASGTPNVPNNAWQQLTAAFALNGTEYDTDGIWDGSGKMVIQHAGKYRITASVSFANNTTGWRYVTITKNSTSVTSPAQVAEAGVGEASAATTQELTATVDINCVAGDYFCAHTWQNSGAGLNLNQGVMVNFSVTKIDGAVVSYVGVPGSLVGQELAYNEYTSTVTANAVAEASALTVVTASAVTFDGVTPVNIEFFSPSIVWGGTVTGGIDLYDGSTNIGRLFDASIVTGTASGATGGGVFRRRLTPTAGSHTYSARIWNTVASNFLAGGGVGGANTMLPGHIRITRAA